MPASTSPQRRSHASGALPNQASTLRRACAANSGRISKEISRPPGATACSSAIDSAPEPAPASSTVMPGCTSAAMTISEIVFG
jgi:hypothetical protein